jgi:hypothetical protein
MTLDEIAILECQLFADSVFLKIVVSCVAPVRFVSRLSEDRTKHV